MDRTKEGKNMNASVLGWHSDDFHPYLWCIWEHRSRCVTPLKSRRRILTSR